MKILVRGSQDKKMDGVHKDVIVAVVVSRHFDENENGERKASGYMVERVAMHDIEYEDAMNAAAFLYKEVLTVPPFIKTLVDSGELERRFDYETPEPKEE